MSRCGAGAKHGKRYVLWGDSHARMWRPFVSRLAAAEQASLASFSYPACPPLVQFGIISPDHPGHSARCADFDRGVIAQLRASNVGKVFVTACWPLYAGDSRGSTYARSSRNDVLLASALMAVRSAIGPDIDVGFIGPVPELKRRAPCCLAHHAEQACAMTARDFDAYAKLSRTGGIL